MGIESSKLENFNKIIDDDLNNFITGKDKNKWFSYIGEDSEEDIFKVYLRKSNRILSDNKIKNKTLDLATIEVDENYQNKGIFKMYLTKLEQICEKYNLCIYVENIMVNHIKRILIERNYLDSPFYEDCKYKCSF
jgi:GNAT superfamily N-acetyltransferase